MKGALELLECVQFLMMLHGHSMTESVHLCCWGQSSCPGFRLICIHSGECDAPLRKVISEEHFCAAIQGFLDKHVVTGLQQRQHCCADGRHATCNTLPMLYLYSAVGSILLRIAIFGWYAYSTLKIFSVLRAQSSPMHVHMYPLEVTIAAFVFSRAATFSAKTCSKIMWKRSGNTLMLRYLHHVQGRNDVPGL